MLRLRWTAIYACSGNETKYMLGWTLVFALMALLGALFTLASPGAGIVSIEFATIVFGALFFACILTRIARRRV